MARKGKTNSSGKGSQSSEPKASILIVDDREDNLDALEVTLSDFGQSLVRARSGQEALRLAFDSDFAVILLDVRMPDMDGFETAELLRKRHRSLYTPIIFITAADATPEQIARGYAVGAVDFIFKPYAPEVLKAKVRIFLDLFRKSEALKESQERMRSLIANVPGAVYRRNFAPPYDLQFISDYIQEISGYPASDFLNRSRNYSSIVYPDDLGPLRAARGQAVQNGVPYALEYRIMHRDGGIRWVLDQGRGVLGHSGKTDFLDGFLFEVTARKSAEEALRELAGRLIHLQEEERKRVGRELHDHISQELALLAIKLDEIALGDLAQHSKDIAEDVRHLWQRLHPSALENQGLMSALQNLVNEFHNRRGIRVDFSAASMPDKLPPEVALCLFRIAEEGLNNVAQHSGARSARLDLAADGDRIRMVVQDEGIGFDPTMATQTGHLGLISMRERLRLVRGSISVHSSPSRGAKIEVSIPLVSPAPN